MFALYPDPIRIDWTRCPIIVRHEFGLLPQLGIGVSYFKCVAEIQESQSFKRAIAKLDSGIQKAWRQTKVTLAQTTAGKGLDFKQWKPDGPDYYSVRVNDNFRAHLRYDRGSSVWFAVRIGNHKDMGHG